jgi:uncharacterized membrane protein
VGENDEPVTNKHEVEGVTGEAKPESNGKLNKYDAFAARVINIILSVAISTLAASLIGAIFFSVLYSANFPYTKVVQVVVVIFVVIYIFRSTWNFLNAPDVMKSKSMELWVYIKKQWKEFNLWIRSLGHNA